MILQVFMMDNVTFQRALQKQGLMFPVHVHSVHAIRYPVATTKTLPNAMTNCVRR